MNDQELSSSRSLILLTIRDRFDQRENNAREQQEIVAMPLKSHLHVANTWTKLTAHGV